MSRSGIHLTYIISHIKVACFIDYPLVPVLASTQVELQALSEC